MAYDAGVQQVQHMLSYDFQHPGTLQRALIAGDTNSDDREGHRPLAQLGDQLIGFVLMSEGYDRGLSRREQQSASSHYRSKEVCSVIAKGRYIDQMVKISDRQMHEGPQPTVLKNTLAAIIGAVWIDSRSHEIVRQAMSSLGLFNDLQCIDPRMLLQPAASLSGRLQGHTDAEMADLLMQDSIDVMLDDSPNQWQLTPGALSMQMDMESFRSDLSIDSSDIYTPSASTEDRSTPVYQPQCLESSLQVDSDAAQDPPSRGLRNDFRAVLQKYLGHGLRLSQDRRTFDRYYCQLARYEEAIGELKMTDVQKRSAAKIITAIGDSSALLMLKCVLGGRCHADSTTGPPNLNQRLSNILLLECAAENTRLELWIHMCRLVEELTCQANDQIAAAKKDSAKTRAKADGNPANHKQAIIASLISDISPSNVDSLKAKKLRRAAQRLLTLTDRWSCGILAVLGVGFGTFDLMQLSDKAFNQVFDLVASLEGSRLSQLSMLAEPVVQAIGDGMVSGNLQLQLAGDELIQSLPRMSHDMDGLFALQ